MARKGSKPSGKRDFEAVLDEAVKCAKTAKRNRASLAGDNYYAQKFFSLKSEATQLFSGTKLPSPEIAASVAEMIDLTFNPRTPPKERLRLSREIVYRLRTPKITVAKTTPTVSGAPFFPTSLLTETRRGYIQRIGNEINGCYLNRLYSGCMVMMRRLLEVAIIELYEGKGIQASVQDGNGNYKTLEKLVDAVVAETSHWRLSRPAKTYITPLREFGNLSAHGKHFHARPEDVESVRVGFRVVIEELLRNAGLIK